MLECVLKGRSATVQGGELGLVWVAGIAGLTMLLAAVLASGSERVELLLATLPFAAVVLGALAFRRRSQKAAPVASGKDLH